LRKWMGVTPVVKEHKVEMVSADADGP